MQRAPLGPPREPRGNIHFYFSSKVTFGVNEVEEVHELSLVFEYEKTRLEEAPAMAAETIPVPAQASATCVQLQNDDDVVLA